MLLLLQRFHKAWMRPKMLQRSEDIDSFWLPASRLESGKETNIRALGTAFKASVKAWIKEY